MQLNCIREVSLFQFQGGLLLYIVRLEIEKYSDLMSHSLSMSVFIHESQAVSIRPVDQRVDTDRSQALALEFKPIVVYNRRQRYN